MPEPKRPKKASINIVFCSPIWLDLSNDRAIGDADELIKYVNSFNLCVKNELSFTRSNEFWYNREQKDL